MNPPQLHIKLPLRYANQNTVRPPECILTVQHFTVHSEGKLFGCVWRRDWIQRTRTSAFQSDFLHYPVRLHNLCCLSTFLNTINRKKKLFSLWIFLYSRASCLTHMTHTVTELHFIPSFLVFEKEGQEVSFVASTPNSSSVPVVLCQARLVYCSPCIFSQCQYARQKQKQRGRETNREGDRKDWGQRGRGKQRGRERYRRWKGPGLPRSISLRLIERPILKCSYWVVIYSPFIR